MCPFHSFAASPSIDGDIPFGIDDGNLTPFFSLERVFGEQPVDHLLSPQPLPQQLQTARPIPAVHRGLRGHGADARLGPRHVIPDREHARRHGDARSPWRGSKATIENVANAEFGRGSCQRHRTKDSHSSLRNWPGPDLASMNASTRASDRLSISMSVSGDYSLRARRRKRSNLR